MFLSDKTHNEVRYSKARLNICSNTMGKYLKAGLSLQGTGFPFFKCEFGLLVSYDYDSEF